MIKYNNKHCIAYLNIHDKIDASNCNRHDADIIDYNMHNRNPHYLHCQQYYSRMKNALLLLLLLTPRQQFPREEALLDTAKL